MRGGRLLIRRRGPVAIGWLLLAFGVVWVLVHAFGQGFGSEGNVPQFIVVGLNGVSLAALYFITAAGFTLIFGLMRVVNMAHGSLYLLGGYVALDLVNHGTNWWLALGLAALITGTIGLLVHQTLLRWNQGQDLRQALITIAVSVIFADQMVAHYGGIVQSINQPTSWPNSITVGALHYGFFRLTVVLGAAVAIGVLLYLLIKRTRFGMIVRAGVDDRSMLSALGVNVQLVFAGAFFLGACLAGFGGVLGGTMISVGPGLDTQFLLDALIVVIIGGMGSLVGAAVGALLLALVQNYSAIYLHFGSLDLSNYGVLTSFILVIAVLAVRPYGLFGRPA
jgi:branched-chain amino acid transport system permease protein